jgi:hypothetical protein
VITTGIEAINGMVYVTFDPERDVLLLSVVHEHGAAAVELRAAARKVLSDALVAP